MQVPRGSAYATMAWLKNRARARSLARQQGSRISSAGLALFCSPGKAPSGASEEAPAVVQSSDFATAVEDIMSNDFIVYFPAIGRIAQLAPSAAELKSSRGGSSSSFSC